MENDFRLNWRIGARTACLIVNVAARFKSTIAVRHEGRRASARSVMDLMLLGPPNAGARITVTISGTDAALAMREMRRLFAEGLHLDCCPYRGCASTPILVDYFEDRAIYGCSNWHAWEVTGKSNAFMFSNPHKGVAALVASVN